MRSISCTPRHTSSRETNSEEGAHGDHLRQLGIKAHYYLAQLRQEKAYAYLPQKKPKAHLPTRLSSIDRRLRCERELAARLINRLADGVELGLCLAVLRAAVHGDLVRARSHMSVDGDIFATALCSDAAWFDLQGRQGVASQLAAVSP